MRIPFLQAVKQRLLVGDGAMGTQLIEAGLAVGGCGAEWNLTHADRVRAIHSAYVAAGSDLLLTNSFGGCPLTLARHGRHVKRLGRGSSQRSGRSWIR